MAKLLGLFLTAAQIFDNRREEIGQDRAVLTASIRADGRRKEHRHPLGLSLVPYGDQVVGIL
jgi:hypothetical protein